MVARLLFPFAATYRSLDLKKRWWHRLALAGLVLFVFSGLALTFAITLDSDFTAYKAAAASTVPEPGNTEHGPWEQYAEITTLPALPKGFSAVVIVSGQGERIQFPAETTKGELMKALCGELKQRDPACWEVVSVMPAPTLGENHAERRSAPASPVLWRCITRDIALAVGVALAINYLLQLVYRATIFVVFGKPELGPG